jgi:hypothetical protein
MAAVTPIADIAQRHCHVRFVPKAALSNRSKQDAVGTLITERPRTEPYGRLSRITPTSDV